MFTPGVSGNPNGRPKLCDEVKDIRKRTKEAIAVVFDEFANMTLSDLEKIDPNELPLFASGILKSLLMYRKTGQMGDLKYIIDRICGRPKEIIELDANKIDFTEEEKRYKDILDQEVKKINFEKGE